MTGFPELNLPISQLRIAEENGVFKVFDILRKKNVILTPEEFVRQSFISWLIHGLNYPPSLMANEISISLNGTTKRCDTVIFDSSGDPFVIIEYKAPDIKITQHVFDQIVRYNMVLKARYLIISNGLSHYCCQIDYQQNKYQFLPSIPDYYSIRNIT